jgi:hypothetical protein
LWLTRGPLELIMRRRKFHRIVFLAAGLYNIGWGLYSVADPQWMFRFADMPLQNYPEIFACLGMVLGLYGILYLSVALAPEQGWLIGAVGLAGKLLHGHQRPLARRDTCPVPDQRLHMVAAVCLVPV